MSFAEALQSKADETQESHLSQAAAAATETVDQPRVPTSLKWQQAGQSAPTQIVNSSPLDNMVSNCSAAVHDRVQWCCVKRS
jgi:hypothetical protein